MKILLKKKKNDQFQFVDLKQNTVPYIAAVSYTHLTLPTKLEV